mgnify:CR=1 FL=1
MEPLEQTLQQHAEGAEATGLRLVRLNQAARLMALRGDYDGLDRLAGELASEAAAAVPDRHGGIAAGGAGDGESQDEPDPVAYTPLTLPTTPTG